ncbi:MAG: hypothetical protein QNJ31_09615 [Candidatus Caenarcaniphilales bacterium]|nr:hypothetical protein [Candidatus Caenarcaniphilales bacterium]
MSLAPQKNFQRESLESFENETVNSAENQITSRLQQLEAINTKLLEALKTSKNHLFGNLLDERLTLSSEIDKLSRKMPIQNVELSDHTKAIVGKVLTQDKELMIYLEREVQKLKGKYQRLKLVGQTQVK